MLENTTKKTEIKLMLNKENEENSKNSMNSQKLNKT